MERLLKRTLKVSLKKSLKKGMAVVLAATMTLSVGTVANAKTVKLSKKSVTVAVGETKTIIVKNLNAKKIKSIKAVSDNKKVAKVKKNGKTKIKVSGVKEGTAKVKVTLKIKKGKKVQNKKLILKVTVTKNSKNANKEANKKVEETTKEEETTMADTSILNGKTIVWLGSSVTRGYGSNGYTMADGIAAKHSGTVCEKYAVDGTTLVNESSTSYVARMMNEIDTNKKIDIFVLQLSTNDATNKKTIGEVSTSTDIKDFDDKTVVGAMETIIAYVKNTWNCPIVIYTSPKYANTHYEQMVQKTYDVVKKWNIGLIDLWTDPDMTPAKSGYMKDAIHPTRLGYDNLWTPKFEAYLAEYLKK
ncbi:MAG: SGNH/GDSL hydrolase family protein [Lachnospiraceae bacterium]|nr:SGNH/GDSL hydrolase family protein [Lachnospiraceae bacterium]